MRDGRLELVDAAYRLELDEQRLVAALLDVYTRRFAPDAPSIVMLPRVDLDGAVVCDAMATSNDPANLLPPLFAVARTHATAEDAQRIFYGAPAHYSSGTLLSESQRTSLMARGLREFVGMCCPVGDTRSISIGVARTEPYWPKASERTYWEPVAHHLAAAMRLRGVLARDLPEVVLRADGAVADARGSARSRSARDALRHAVRMRERRRSRRARDTEPFWPELVAGRWTLVDRFDSDGRRHVIAVRNDHPGLYLRVLTPREQEVLAGVRRGISNKALALELGMSEATVSRTVSSAMAKLGVNLAEVADLASASRSTHAIGALPVALVGLPGGAPGADLARLSAAEREVVRLALRGHSNAQIATLRGRSLRTVVNQLRTAYAKLGLQSRRELVLHWHAAVDGVRA